MSGECSKCNEHALECRCEPLRRRQRNGRGYSMIKIEEKDLLELIYWARRYCDGRATYAPTRFNQLYEKIVQLNPKIKSKDEFDHTLKDKGAYWPYAQDGMYNPENGHFDARPIESMRINDGMG